jgi:hypothetical protein
MQRIWKVLILSATIAVVSAPALARADSYVSPFLGTNFGNNSGNGRVNVGANAGWMWAGIIGAEVDFGYAPNFFGNQSTFGSNSVTDLMANLIVGVPTGGTHGSGVRPGGTHGSGVRPYATIGIGLLRSQVNGATSSAASITDNGTGMNAGAGVMGDFSRHLGIRGDVRYFRNLSNVSNANINFGEFHFWRASVGIVLRP